MPHYICTGTDKGISEKPGVCQGVGCSKEGQQLEACDCLDDKHNGRQTHDTEPPEDLSIPEGGESPKF